MKCCLCVATHAQQRSSHTKDTTAWAPQCGAVWHGGGEVRELYRALTRVKTSTAVLRLLRGDAAARLPFARPGDARAPLLALRW